MVHLSKVCKVSTIKWVLVLDLKCPNFQMVVLTHLMVVVLINHQVEVDIQCLNRMEVDILCNNLVMVAHQLSVVTAQHRNLITLPIVLLLLLEVVDLAIAILTHNLLVHVKHPLVHHHLMDNNVDHHSEVMADNLVHKEQLRSVIHVEPLLMVDIIEERTQESYVNI